MSERQEGPYDKLNPRTYRRNFSRLLHVALAEGNTVVVGDAAGPAFRGLEVEYAPRNRQDCRPWRPIAPDKRDARFSGNQCRVAEPVRFSGKQSRHDITVTALVHDRGVGHLSWDARDGIVRYVWTAPDRRGRGIATGMWRYALTLAPAHHPRHSQDLTPDGLRWVARLRELRI